MRSRRDRKHGHLFHRVYRHGVLLVLFVGLTVFGVGALLRPDRPWQELHEHIVQYMAAHFSDLRDDPEQLRTEVRRARELLDIDLSIYGPAGELEATNVTPPLPPRGDPPDAPRTWHERRRMHVSAPLANGAVAIARGPRWPTPPVPVQLVIVLACLGVVALASYPLARGIVRPLERLTETARALGRGDLSVRSGLTTRGEVGTLAQAVDEMADRLQRQMAAEKALLANVSHELRTPLARIRVAVELAEDGGPAAAEYLREIGADIDELDRLLTDLMTTVRLDAAPPLRRERVEARALLERAVQRFQGLFPDRALVVDVPEHLPALDADPVMLRRVLDNLLDNARKYSDAPITLRVRLEAERLHVAVVDAGAGIAPDDVARLFTPFFRTDASRDRGTGGVGLGLALAKRIVEAHGGEIGVDSAPGRGSTFWFRVPFRAPAQGTTSASM